MAVNSYQFFASFLPRTGIRSGDVCGHRQLPSCPNCGRYCGADVDFVDIEPAAGLMSVSSQSKIGDSGDGRLPKVVVPVHLCGPVATWNRSCSGDRYGFAVVEDASHDWWLLPGNQLVVALIVQLRFLVSTQ